LPCLTQDEIDKALNEQTPPIPEPKGLVRI